MQDFLGRGALITGGASGIGLAMAEAFAARGARLVLCDADTKALATSAERLRAAGAEVLPIELDVTDRSAWRTLPDRLAGFGRVHIACANAGIAPAGMPLIELPPEKWDRILAINLTGVMNTLQAAVPLIDSHGEGGHLVLTSSMAGMIAASPIGDYTVAKYGVSAIGEILRVELAGRNIGVSVLYPGVVATNLVGESKSAGMSAAAVAQRVITAIEANELFVFTHANYRELVEARMRAILSAFGESAVPDFTESADVLRMMKTNAYPP